MHLEETFWKKAKFFIVFSFTSIIIYVLLTKMIFRIPQDNNRKLLVAINEYETVLKRQKETSQDIWVLHDTISKLDFNVNMVQLQNDLEREINQIDDIYEENNNNYKYIFSTQASRLLKIYMDSREAHCAIIHGKKIVGSNYKECEAKIE
ncbi:type VI secretion system TssO [Flagellimonas marinaquae]|uniref:type VI secretion system TssO n=1 Tax=Flagellimonas marinaquae TaxID=254955 RepID=UPI00207574E0|nr:type VI secretion system TssO [Allomuricauda aquimarina]USD26867.1 type VI secretion system transmembrane protein TssO [Allomuricauda aquimarina]